MSSLDHITFLLADQKGNMGSLTERMDNLTLRVHAALLDIVAPAAEIEGNVQAPEDDEHTPLFSRTHSLRLSSVRDVWSPIHPQYNFQLLIAFAEEHYFGDHDLPGPSQNIPLTQSVTIFTFNTADERDTFADIWTLRPEDLEHIQVTILPDL